MSCVFLYYGSYFILNSPLILLTSFKNLTCCHSDFVVGSFECLEIHKIFLFCPLSELEYKTLTSAAKFPCILIWRWPVPLPPDPSNHGSAFYFYILWFYQIRYLHSKINYKLNHKISLLGRFSHVLHHLTIILKFFYNWFFIVQLFQTFFFPLLFPMIQFCKYRDFSSSFFPPSPFSSPTNFPSIILVV